MRARGNPAERRLARLDPPAREEVNRALAAGHAVSSRELAALAAAVGAGRLAALRRQGVVVAAVLAIGMAGVVGLVADAVDALGLVSGVLLAGVVSGLVGVVFTRWWRSAMLTPLQRAVEANEETGGDA